MIALLLRDLRLAIRAGGGFGQGLAFLLILATLIPLAVGPRADLLAPVAPGILWLGTLLACLLSLDRLFALDLEDGSLDLLTTSPIPLEGVAFAKAGAHWLTTGLPLTLAAPALGPLLSLPGAALPWLALSLLLGTPALSLIGTFGAALTVGLKRGSRGRERGAWSRDQRRLTRSTAAVAKGRRATQPSVMPAVSASGVARARSVAPRRASSAPKTSVGM